MNELVLVLKEWDGDRAVAGGFALNLVVNSNEEDYSFSYDRSSTYRTTEERNMELTKMRKLAAKLAKGCGVEIKENLFS